MRLTTLFNTLLLLTMLIPVSLFAQDNPQTTPVPSDLQRSTQSEPPPLGAESTSSSKAAAASPTENQTLEKYVWLTKIKKELSQKSCEEDQYFMHCFDVDHATCLQFTEIYLTACMDNLAPQIPAMLTPKEAQKWGPMLVFCSHDLYTRFMADKKKSLPECESPKPEPQGN